jgi:hypothetical protein
MTEKLSVPLDAALRELDRKDAELAALRAALTMAKRALEPFAESIKYDFVGVNPRGPDHRHNKDQVRDDETNLPNGLTWGDLRRAHSTLVALREKETRDDASLAGTQRASFVRGELGNIKADRAMTSLTKPKPIDPLNRDEAYSDKLADNFRGWP